MKVDRKTAAYTYLKDAILSGHFPEGAPIREMEIAETLQMSRAPIREAIRLLEREGVLVSYPSRGAFVASLTPHDVEEICELRILHEVYALEKSFDSFTVNELDYYKKAFIESYKQKDWETYHRVDQNFHGLILNKCGSSRLLGFIGTLNIQIERLRRYMAQNPRRMQESCEEHLRIIEYIRSHELQLAKQEMEKHLRGVMISSVETHSKIQTKK